ncbi:hypothetical protein [Tateyamaria pelophila]|uniref:hypothetical protein n=1 Tax=Tateyamaria pelophila TaxID=328415 RepID=UPI001CBE6DF8|nr:hypothetical protein [Tateyamaria pelophila]
MTHLSLAADNLADELEICTKEMQFMLADKGSADPPFVRFVCARCSFEGNEAMDPRSTLLDLKKQAEAMFDAAVEWQTLA